MPNKIEDRMFEEHLRFCSMHSRYSLL